MTIGLQSHHELFQQLHARIAETDAEKGDRYIVRDTIPVLRVVLRDELHELDKALALESIDRQIAEALDVAICGLLIASKLIKETEI